MVSAVPIAVQAIDWTTFLKGAALATGRSASSSLDDKGLPAFGQASFVGAVAEFGRPNSDPIKALRNDRLVLKHVHVAFLIEMPRHHFFTLSVFGLAVTPADVGDFAVVSGTLDEWYHAIREGLRDDRYVFELRQVCCILLRWFERADLGEVWGNFEKRTLPDKTFVLEEKR